MFGRDLGNKSTHSLHDVFLGVISKRMSLDVRSFVGIWVLFGEVGLREVLLIAKPKLC